MEPNRVEIEGRVTANGGLRRTPAGLASLILQLAHESVQSEAGHARTVHCELDAIAYGGPATALAGVNPGDKVKLAGFLERRNLHDSRPIMHITAYEI